MRLATAAAAAACPFIFRGVTALLLVGCAAPALAQVLAPSADDADAGTSYTLRKSLLWYNRYVPDRAVHGAAYVDLDRDGRMDVVFAPLNFAGGGSREKIRVMMNTGSGFADQSATRLSNTDPGVVHARETLAGDFNGDGWVDVFIAGHGYDVPPFPGEHPLLYLNNGNGTLRYDNHLEAQVGFHHGAASGDVDHDGDLDILMVQQGRVHFLVNDGSAHFTRDDARLPGELLHKNYFTGEVADVDRDGHLDVILGGHEFEGAPTVVYWGDASGTFSASRKTVLPEVAGKAIVMAYGAEDIDGDGDRDLVISRTGQSPFYSGRYLQVLVQGQAREFADETATRITMNTTQQWIDYLRLQDVNGDGRLDILHDDQNASYNGEAVWINDGKGVFTPYAGPVQIAPVFDVLPMSIAEGNAGPTQVGFTLRSSQPLVAPLSFDAYTEGGTATPGQDYFSNAIETKVMLPTQSTWQVYVNLSGDTTPEPDETFGLHIANLVGGIAGRASAMGRIVNDDLPALSVVDASVTEGNAGRATLRFVVSLSAPVGQPVQFAIATADGSASAPADYLARTSSTRVLDAGRTEAVFEVAVAGDAVAEGNETMQVTLSNVTGATVADGTATGTILDDDAAAAPTATALRAPVVIAARSVGSQCAEVATQVATLETRVATGRLGEVAGIARIAALERRAARLGCAPR